MSVKLLTEQYLEYLSLKGSCAVSSESTLDKMPHCCKSHVTAQMSSVCLCLVVPWVGLQFETVVFPDHTHLSVSLPRGSMGWSTVWDCRFS